MLKLINYTHQACLKRIEDKIPMKSIIKTRIFETIIGIKYAIDNDLEMFKDYYKQVDEALASIE